MHVNLRAMTVEVLVDDTFMFMDVGVHNLHFDVVMTRCKPMSDPLRDAGEIKDSKENQHQAYGQFHSEADARRDCQVEQNNGHPDEEDRNGVAYSPQCANHACVPDSSLTAHNCRNGNDMIGIGGVANPKKKSHANHCQQVQGMQSAPP